MYRDDMPDDWEPPGPSKLRLEATLNIAKSALESCLNDLMRAYKGADNFAVLSKARARHALTEIKKLNE